MLNGSWTRESRAAFLEVAVLASRAMGSMWPLGRAIAIESLGEEGVVDVYLIDVSRGTPEGIQVIDCVLNVSAESGLDAAVKRFFPQGIQGYVPVALNLGVDAREDRERHWIITDASGAERDIVGRPFIAAYPAAREEHGTPT